MDADQRSFPPPDAAEYALLDGFLRYGQETMLHKIDGLSNDDLRRVVVPSGTTLLGMVKHLAFVHRSWFRAELAGENVDFPWTDEDPDADWRVEPHETTEDIVRFYREELERCRAVTASIPLNTPLRDPDHPYTLRWLMSYMIVEVARHCGHADILRELIDGKTGR